MINLLKNIFKKVQKSDSASQGICKYESATNDCSLIQQLKEKQAEARVIESEIKSYDKDDLSIISHVIDFLRTLEQYGFRMNDFKAFGYSEDVDRMFVHYNEVSILERALYNMSTSDIDSIANELKSLKQKTVTLEEKNSALEAVNKDIANIKTRLGIE